MVTITMLNTSCSNSMESYSTTGGNVMLKTKFSKKILTVMAVLTLCVAVSLTVFAAEPTTTITKSNSVVTPDAISGSGSASGSSGSFQIYSPGWGKSEGQPDSCLIRLLYDHILHHKRWKCERISYSRRLLIFVKV